ncbi:MAG: efflux transporter periplasmic adaptor subunit, partial [Magnetococcales bacterium]|nr:efflux transporter periplasmic adaptor subunit [Magnetococcales bacterium]
MSSEKILVFIGAVCTMLGLGYVLAADAPRPAVTNASPVRPGLEQREIRAQLAPRRYTTLSAEIGAKIDRITVQEGAGFQAGQTLIVLNCSMQQAQLAKATAALAAAKKVLGANKRLSELNSVGKVELGVSEAEEQKAQAEVKLMAVAISKCQITAPFNGRVAEQKV